MSYDVLVVGAGLAGASSARLLAEKGRRVTVLEAREHVAGNCYDEKMPSGITVHRYGPHIFHTKDKAVWDFACRFTEMRPFQHRVLSYAQGQFLPFPINRDTLCQLFGLQLSTREVRAFLDEEVKRSTFSTPPTHFRDAIVSQVGEYLYRCFFENYTAKQWQKRPEELSVEVAGRIPIRENRDDRYFTDPWQGIPTKGYTALCEAMLDHSGIEVKLASPYERGMEKDAELLVYTGRLDEFFAERHGRLQYRSVRFEFKTVDEEYYQAAAVVNYPNDYDFTRITEFKQMTGEKSPVSEICLEYPTDDGVPSYVVLNEENIVLRDRYQEEVKKLEAAGRTSFIGRLAEYRYYNMDQVLAQALERFGN